MLARSAGLLSLIHCGAIFGFFYAWVCSTMWGLDKLDPQTAIAAMQAMNDSVRNAVFFPAFFGTPVVLAITSLICMFKGYRHAALAFASAAAIYLLGSFAPTVAINVPMNEALAMVEIPPIADEAHTIWEAYSDRWQFWNVVRTIASGLSLLACGGGLMKIGTNRQVSVRSQDV